MEVTRRKRPEKTTIRTENSVVVEAFGLLYGCFGKTRSYVLHALFHVNWYGWFIFGIVNPSASGGENSLLKAVLLEIGPGSAFELFSKPGGHVG